MIDDAVTARPNRNDARGADRVICVMGIRQNIHQTKMWEETIYQ